jgi:hypothetical protein
MSPTREREKPWHWEESKALPSKEHSSFCPKYKTETGVEDRWAEWQ